MTNPKPPSKINPIERHDPYAIRNIEQILGLFDDGDFLTKVLEGHKTLQTDLLDHKDEHGTKDCQGTMTIQISYALGKQGDVNMGATVAFKAPKKPPSSASAYIGEDGQLTLYSPMMARMHGGVRDVTNFDPEIGEIRDAD